MSSMSNGKVGNSSVDFDEYRRSILQKAGLASQIWETPKPGPVYSLGPAPLIPDENVKAHKHKVIGELQHSFDLLNGKSPVNSPQDKPEFLKPEVTRKKPAPSPPKVKAPAPLPPPSTAEFHDFDTKLLVNGFSPKQQRKKVPPEVPKKPAGSLTNSGNVSRVRSPSDEFKSKNAYQKYIESFTQEQARSTVKDFAENRFLGAESNSTILPQAKQPPPKVLPKPTKVLESSNWPPGESETDQTLDARSVTPTGDTWMGNRSTRPKHISLFENNSENQQKANQSAKNLHSSPSSTQHHQAENESELKRPTQRELEKSRREAVREQAVRPEPLKQWNINDISPDSDFFPPKTRIQTLRRLSDEKEGGNPMMHSALDLNTEMVQKKRHDFESGRIYAKGEARLRDQQGYWPGQEEGKLTSPIPGNARDLWERRIQQHNNWLNEQKQQVPDSRRWKSLDALSASLLGTHIQDPWEIQAYTYRHNVHQGSSIEKPGFNPEIKDPLFRLPVNYLEKTERRSMDNLDMSATAATVNSNIHREPTPVNVGGPNWYDQSKIREAISRESIADLGQTKHKWERRVEESRQGTTSPPYGDSINRSASYQTHTLPYSSSGISSAYFPSEHRPIASSTAHVIHSNNPHPLPGESARSLNIIEQEISQYRIREEELQSRPALSPLMMSGGEVSNAQIEKEKQMLLIYLNTRPEVVNELGLILPHPIKQQFRNLGPHVPLVELQESRNPGAGSGYRHAAQSPVVMNGNAAAMNGYGYMNGGSRGSTLERPGSLGPAGRYIKNTQPSSRKIVRKPSMETAPIRSFAPSTEKSGGGGGADDNSAYLSPGESIIAREIRELKEKEQELRRSRSELGLPTLEDTLETWKSSQGQYRTQIPLRGAQSYDHLHQAVQNEGSFTLPRSHRNAPIPGAGGMSLPFKAGSLDHIHQTSTMTSHEDEANGFTSVGRVVPPPRHNKGGRSPYEQYLAAHHPPKNQSPEFPVASGEGNGGNGGGGKRLVPVESRIEQEVADLKQREAEIRQYRELYSPSLSQPKIVEFADHGASDQDNLSLKSGEGSENGVGTPKSGEYVAQKMRGFKLVDSGETYDFRRETDYDEMILVPNGKHAMNSWIGHRS